MSRYKNTIIGIDIGSHTIRGVAAFKNKDGSLQIISAQAVPSDGVRKGLLINLDDATKATKILLERLESDIEHPVKNAYFSVDGPHISIKPTRGIIIVSRADSEITENDIARAFTAAQAVALPKNKEILHVIPREFVIDGEDRVKDPVGMKGLKLELNALVIESYTPQIKNITKLAENLGIAIEGLVLSSLAASKAVLNKRQKELGTLVLDIGAATTGLAVYEDGELLHANILPIGSAHITNDIAIGLRTNVDVAEQIKICHGICLAGAVSKKDVFDLQEFGQEGIVSKKELARIIEARLCEILDMVNKELKKISRDGLLPGGAVLCGGASKIFGLIDLVKRELKLPVVLGSAQNVSILHEKADDPAFINAIGLTLWGAEYRDESFFKSVTFLSINFKNKFFKKIQKFLRSLIP